MDQKRVLYADNDTTYLEARSAFLEIEGYQVIKASCPEDAERILERENIHLAILDIRLVDDNDEGDISGILLAKDERFKRVPKIFVTGYPTYEAVREAYGPFIKTDPIALAFLAKKEGPRLMVDAVNAAFQDSVGIHWDLKVLPDEQGMLSFPSLALMLENDLDPGLILPRSGELKDLFCKLFNGYEQISFLRINWLRSGCGCLTLYASRDVASQQAVVVFGPWSAVNGQRERAVDFINKVPGVLPQPLFAESMRYAVLAYWMPDSGKGPALPGSSYFQESGEKSVKAALEYLYEQVVLGWQHHERSELGKADLAALYRDRLRIPAHRDSFEEARQKELALAGRAKAFSLVREITLDDRQIEFVFANGEQYRGPDPVAALMDVNTFSRQSATIATTFGGIGSGVLLIDPEGRTYPVDLSSVTRSPILEDFASLECEFHFDRIPSDNLYSLLDFEKQLCDSKTLNDQLSAVNVEPECRKSLTAVQTIRRLAGKTEGSALEPYLIGLFHYMVKPLLVYDPQVHLARYQTAQLVHRLLASSLVLTQIQGLGGDPEPGAEPATSDGLKVNEASREVSVDGREVRLTQTEFKLLLFLYKNPNRLCSREEILTEVFEIKGSASRSDKGLLNTHIDRLRKKVNLNPAKHNYIVTIRGEGYMLELKT